MTAIDPRLQDIRREHPEWEPWLAVVQRILYETANPKWDAAVPPRPGAPEPNAPLLTGAPLALEKNLLHRLFEELIGIAYQSGTPRMATLEAALRARLDLSMLFSASLTQDGDRLREQAIDAGADPGALQAVATLFCVPFLQACNRHWGPLIPGSWTEGYCPICGAWPALSEVRGIERSRYFRCGRCGAGWQAHCLFCPYCGMTDHEQLLSLVPDKSGSNGAVEACRRCLGYVKTFTVLQASPAAQVMLDDLASVALDVAALEQGYRRCQSAAYNLNVTVTSSGAYGAYPA